MKTIPYPFLALHKMRVCDSLPANSHRISFFPADSGRGLPCNVDIKPELVSCNDDNGVFVDHAASGVQVDFGWF